MTCWAPSSSRRSRWIAAAVWLGLIWLSSLWYYWPSLGWPVGVHTGRLGGRPAGAGTREPGDARMLVAAVARVSSPRDAVPWFTRQWYPGVSEFYRPITLASVWFDSAVWGQRALGYRLHNLLLHVTNAALLGLLVMAVARSFWPGAAASLLVALWAGASAAVTWVAGRADLLAAFFFLVALLLLLAIGRGRRRRWLWPLAIVAFLLALGSKESAVAFPPLVTAWVLIFWPTPLSRGRRAAIALSLWAALGAFWLVRTWALGTATSGALDLAQLRRASAAFHYADFLVPAATAWYAYPWVGWLSVLTPQFWAFVGHQVIWWGCAVLLLVTVPGPTLAFFLWKAIAVPPILGSPHFFAWAHYWYLPQMGSAALTGLAAWRAAVLAAGVWRRVRQGRPR